MSLYAISAIILQSSHKLDYTQLVGTLGTLFMPYPSNNQANPTLPTPKVEGVQKLEKIKRNEVALSLIGVSKERENPPEARKLWGSIGSLEL